MNRWKAGIEKVTPLERLQATQKGNWVMLVGYLCGLIVMFLNVMQWWWGIIILAGALCNQAVMMIGVSQQIKAFRKVEEMIPSAERRLK